MPSIHIPEAEIMKLNGKQFLILLDLCKRYSALPLKAVCLLAGNALNGHDSLDEFLDSPIDHLVSESSIYHWDEFPSWRYILEKWDWDVVVMTIYSRFSND